MEQFMGFISAFGFNYAPRDWATCAGQWVSISQNQALYSLLGTYYGGDGRSDFAYPELRSRAPIGQGDGPGLSSYPHPGIKIGWYEHELTSAYLPVHSHTAVVDDSAAVPTGTLKASQELGVNEQATAGDYLAVGNVDSADVNKNYVSAENRGATVELGGLVAAGHWFDISGVALGNTGSSSFFSIMQPSLAINYCILLEGVYPSRN